MRDEERLGSGSAIVRGPAEPLVVHPLVRGVLVDEDQARPPLADEIGPVELAQVAQAREVAGRLQELRCDCGGDR